MRYSKGDTAEHRSPLLDMSQGTGGQTQNDIESTASQDNLTPSETTEVYDLDHAVESGLQICRVIINKNDDLTSDTKPPVFDHRNHYSGGDFEDLYRDSVAEMLRHLDIFDSALAALQPEYEDVRKVIDKYQTLGLGLFLEAAKILDPPLTNPQLLTIIAKEVYGLTFRQMPKLLQWVEGAEKAVSHQSLAVRYRSGVVKLKFTLEGLSATKVMTPDEIESDLAYVGASEIRDQTVEALLPGTFEESATDIAVNAMREFLKRQGIDPFAIDVSTRALETFIRTKPELDLAKLANSYVVGGDTGGNSIYSQEVRRLFLYDDSIDDAGELIDAAAEAMAKEMDKVTAIRLLLELYPRPEQVVVLQRLANRDLAYLHCQHFIVFNKTASINEEMGQQELERQWLRLNNYDDGLIAAYHGVDGKAVDDPRSEGYIKTLRSQQDTLNTLLDNMRERQDDAVFSHHGEDLESASLNRLVPRIPGAVLTPRPWKIRELLGTTFEDEGEILSGMSLSELRDAFLKTLAVFEVFMRDDSIDAHVDALLLDLSDVKSARVNKIKEESAQMKDLGQTTYTEVLKKSRLTLSHLR